jgi:hypothetical protein
MIRLDVWLTLPDGSQRRVGEAAFADPDGHGRYASAFRYAADWLNDAGAFPIDPANLPLVPGEFNADRLTSPLMVLEDVLPDVWGRRLLALRHRLARGEQHEPNLLRV